MPHMNGEKVFVVFMKTDGEIEQRMYRDNEGQRVLDLAANLAPGDEIDRIWMLSSEGRTTEITIAYEKGRLKLQQVPQQA